MFSKAFAGDLVDDGDGSKKDKSKRFVRKTHTDRFKDVLSPSGVRERERERENEKERKRERERMHKREKEREQERKGEKEREREVSICDRDQRRSV